eukprot:1607750-Amphidinium_carterae.1
MAVDLFAPDQHGGITDYACLRNFPNPCPRSPFVTLTNASEEDQALDINRWWSKKLLDEQLCSTRTWLVCLRLFDYKTWYNQIIVRSTCKMKLGLWGISVSLV